MGSVGNRDMYAGQARAVLQQLDEGDDQVALRDQVLAVPFINFPTHPCAYSDPHNSGESTTGRHMYP